MEFLSKIAVNKGKTSVSENTDLYKFSFLRDSETYTV
jgi:hypothetical protein